MIYPIIMKDEKDVQRVSKVAADAGIDMSVSSGTAMIDPRSLLGLFNFVGKKVNLVAPDEMDPNYFMKLVKKMGVAA